MVKRIALIGSLGVQMLYWLSVVAVVVFSLVTVDVPVVVDDQDKYHHFIAYAGLAILGCLSYPARAYRAVQFVMLVLLGVGLEWAQSKVPGRFTDFWDVVANTCGVLSGTLIGSWVVAKCKNLIKI